LIIEYASQFGEVKQITILPGNSYGHLVMDSAASAQRIIDSLMEANATLYKKRTLAFFHTTMTKDDLKKNTVIDFPEAATATTGAIPGLYIIDDFVTEEESATLITSLDSTGNWEKLLKRRVQHFGFEFKYGTNDVDPDHALGKFPPMFDFIEPRLKSLLSRFSFDSEGFVARLEQEVVPTNPLNKFGFFD